MENNNDKFKSKQDFQATQNAQNPTNQGGAQAAIDDLQGKGAQIDYGQYLQYKQDFDPNRTISYSSSDLYQKRLSEQSDTETDYLIYGTAASAAKVALFKQAEKSEAITELLSKAPGARLLQQRLSKQFMDNQALGLISNAIDPKLSAQPLSTSLNSMLMAMEEMSPAQILKTLQLSSFNSLFVENVEQLNKQKHIQYSSIATYNNYYKNLILKESKISLTDDDLKHGFVLHKNKLYQGIINKDTGEVTKGRTLLNYATAVHTNIKIGSSRSANRIFEKFANDYDTKVTNKMSDAEPIAIVGAKSKAAARANWIKAYGRFSLEIGAKSLDNPLGFLEEYVNLTGASDSSFVNSKLFQTVKKYTNFKLGTGGVYDTSAADMMKRMSKNLVVKAGVAYIAYQGANSVLDAIAPDSSVWSNGLVAGLSDTLMKSHVKFASLWSDNFQNLKKSQEEAAPESTKLSTLMALPLAGAVMGGNITYFKRQAQTVANGIEQTGIKYVEKSIATGWQGKLLDLIGKNSESTILQKNAKVGALIGAAMALPFLPGALVGKSSAELGEEYSGEKDVAVRRDRGWLCLTADSPVLTSSNLKRADQVSIGDKLFNREGIAQEVSAVHARYTKERTFSLVTNDTSVLYTKITENHEVLTVENGWVKAKDLTLDHTLISGIPNTNEKNNIFDMKQYIKRDNITFKEGKILLTQKNTDNPVKVIDQGILEHVVADYNFGKFLGWFLAEGCTSIDKDGSYRSLDVVFHKTERVFAKEVWEYLNTITTGRDNYKEYNNDPTKSCEDSNSLRSSYINSLLSEFLINYMYEDGEKIFPDLSNKPKEFIRGFLVGLFYGCGSLNKDSFSFSSHLVQHVFEFRRYATVFGAYGCIYLDSSNACYRLDFNNLMGKVVKENIDLYKELYTYDDKEYNEDCYKSYDKIFNNNQVNIKLSKIEEFIYEGYVYDFTMDGLHEYTPTSFVIHNSGGTEYEGGQIKYYRKNLLTLMSSDAKNKTLYGDQKTKRALDPVLNPIKYLQNPYKFEEMHTKDMPMPVWGMDVSYGSFLGQMYKGTIGQVIKPTAINPALIELQKDIKILDVKGNVKEAVSTSLSKKGKVEDGQGNFVSTQDEGVGDTGKINLDYDAYSAPENERKEAKSLVKDGMMLRKNAPTVEIYNRAFAGTYGAFGDFIGVKGFTGNLFLSNAMGMDPTVQLRPELEVSGSATNFTNTLSEANLGDLGGGAEVLRRLFPQSAASKRETVNPMMNQVTPDWLPSNETKYFLNFTRGNYYKNDWGTVLNPGSKGFETVNPELKGINPNDYPLVYQYKVLQNIARGSSEHIAVREYLEKHVDDLSDAEKDVFFEAYGQDKSRDTEKKFFEYKTADEKSKMGMLGLIQNSVWESFAHKENPLEPLLPFRPMAKFVHQRTAEEDYVKTQLMGSDVGIWTNPYSHFIKPSGNRVADLAAIGVFKPEEAIEKENIDTYFDKLGLAKAIRSSSTYDMQRNITALSYLGVNDAQSMKMFKTAAPEGQSAYVESFSKEKDANKRERILALVPTDIGRVYQSVWNNTDIYDRAVGAGEDPREALRREYLKDTAKLQDIMKIQLTRDEKKTIHDTVSVQETDKDKKELEEIESAKVVRMKAAQKDAEQYLESRGSMPNEKWVGWDPRLTTRDIKLKTLMVGKADIHRFGFWAKDVEKVDRLVALDKDNQVSLHLDRIIAEKSSAREREYAMRRKLRQAGFETSTIKSSPSNANRLRIVNQEEN